MIHPVINGRFRLPRAGRAHVSGFVQDTFDAFCLLDAYEVFGCHRPKWLSVTVLVGRLGRF